MVRLKVIWKDGRDGLVHLFQFLYGAIESETDPKFVASAAQFQFLYGAIKSNEPKRWPWWICISIPIWYD